MTASVADDFAVFVQRDFVDIAFGHLKVAGALLAGAVHGADLGAVAFAKVFEACADGEAVFGEGALGAAIDNLQEELAHCRVDGIANEVGSQSSRLPAQGPR